MKNIANKIFCVYQHIRLDTAEVFYVGIGDEKRPYVLSKSKRNFFWNNVFYSCNKNIAIDIILKNISWEEAKLKEKELIKFYGRRNLKLGSLVNLTDGGEGCVGRIFSEEHKKKLSNYAKNMTLEHKLKLSIANKGKIGSNLGRKTSIDTKQKMSQKAKGRKFTQEHKDNLSKALKGRKLSPEHREKSIKSLHPLKYN